GSIGIGAWLGTIMFINVWVIIWPNQKKILGIVTATDEEKNKARRLAFLASRTNTMLSIPLLFFMSASGGVFRTAMFG
ncbi:MAG: urate hydroxylase PuuD, partial [Burkholderiales bacterium]|nr:urate hydroxylase PuuD [Burkholderiales bacterium]